ncbi:MAG: hypothetical protein KJP22_11605 [Acidimicrobiia bacterium]|nr:hypothetical protein [Acidimicrobiia bacterium]NNL13466.1 hypothetical protein [Acidimicrobiia bacterium]
MKSHEEILERMSDANPLPDIDMITDGQLAELTLEFEDRRRDAADIPGLPGVQDRVDGAAAATRRAERRWLKPALAFVAACVLVLGTIGVLALGRSDQTDFVTPLPSDATTQAAPFTGTCPPGTDPDAPGPIGQERPQSDWVGVQAAAFDSSIGRIIYVDSRRETWTFDVCTNSWHRMNPTGRIAGDLSGGLVFDIDSAVTVALGFEQVSVYDAATNTWNQPEDTGVLGFGDGIIPFGGVYDPVSGLVVTSAYRGTEGSTTDPIRLEAWSYDVDTNAWALIGAMWTGDEHAGVRTETDGLVWSDLLGYSPEIDRFIFANTNKHTALVDLRTGDKTVISTITPAVGFGWPAAQYGQAAGTAFVAQGADTTGGLWADALEDQICGFDPETEGWTTCFAMPGGSKYAAYGAMIGDPVNNRLVLIHGVYGDWWVNSDNAVWAIDLDTGETTGLLGPTG